MSGNLRNLAFVCLKGLHTLGEPRHGWHEQAASGLLQNFCFLTQNFSSNALTMCMLELKEYIC